jgi:hypothetical protein
MPSIDGLVVPPIDAPEAFSFRLLDDRAEAEGGQVPDHEAKRAGDVLEHGQAPVHG